MIRISSEHKAIFCHIPRTGGTSIEEVLSDWVRISWNRNGVMNFKKRFIGSGQFIYETYPHDYFVFTTVRNPYDRYLSGLKYYDYISKLPTTNRYWAENLDRMKFWMHEHITATQCKILGDLVPDYIMHLESIDKDFKLIRGKFNIRGDLPKLNSYSQGKLTPEQIDWVTEHFAEDFKAFGYKKR